MKKASPKVTGFAFGLLMLVLAGCAIPPMPPAGGGNAPPAAAAPGARPGAKKPTVAAPAAHAVVDTVPSAEAIEVLRTIPEPLPAGERVPPPDGATSVPDRAAAAPADTAGMPVPEPTYPLGLAPAPPPDTLYNAPRDTVVERATSVPPPEPASHTRPSSSGPPPGLVNPSSSQPAAADTCWRVQVAAPPEKARAEQMKSAAESQLLVPMVIEFEAKRYKVRSKDCLDREGADRLKGRALASGFDGSFRFGAPRK